MTDLKWRFPPELRTLSIIPRWSIVHTQITDTVAAHSFHVVFYARETARLIGWEGNLANLMYRALVHDTEEVVTGDVMGPAKREIIDEARSANYLRVQLLERMPFVVDDLDRMFAEAPVEADEAWRIIRFADKLDALIFLMTEKRLGNGVVAAHIPRARRTAEGAWFKLPSSTPDLGELWRDVIGPAIAAHEVLGGAGLED